MPTATPTLAHAYDDTIYPDKIEVDGTTGELVNANDPMAVTPSKADQANEANILFVTQILHAQMLLLRDKDESNLLHRCMARMMESIGSQGALFSDMRTTVVSNKSRVDYSAGGLMVDLVPVTGTDLPTIIAEFATGPTEAFVTKDGRLGFRNRARAPALPTDPPIDPSLDTQLNVTINISGGAPFGFVDTDHLGPVTVVANAAQERAVQAFESFKRNSKPTGDVGVIEEGVDEL